MKNVLFDMDGVLVDYQSRIRVAHIADALQRTEGEVREAIYASGIEADADAGRLDPGGYLDALAHRLGRALPVDVWTEARRRATRLRPAVMTAVAALARDGVGIAILTNNGWLLAEQWERIVPGLFPLFRGKALVAAEFGVAKPDPAVYLGALARLDWKAEDTLFIDDVQANVDGAVAAGMAARRCDSEDSVRDALARRVL